MPDNDVSLTDNAKEILAQLNANASRGLTAVGIEGVGMIVDQMQSGYGKPIRQTGDLQRDVNYYVDQDEENTVWLGNSLEYSKFVHDGTWKMPKRPYIKDAIKAGKSRLEQILVAYTKQGF